MGDSDNDESKSGAIPGTRKTPSCLTIHDAFGKLFRIDDFTLEILGNGFFSDVYKVKQFLQIPFLRDSFKIN